jgi:hypothetical protein
MGLPTYLVYQYIPESRKRITANIIATINLSTNLFRQ